MEKTIAQQLNVTKFPFIIKDDNRNEIYYEHSIGFWMKREYDDKGNLIYFEDSNGYWSKREYDDNRNEIYYENSSGYWMKTEYDDKENQIYYENSNGNIMDDRPKPTPEYTMEELVNKIGHNFKIKK